MRWNPHKACFNKKRKSPKLKADDRRQRDIHASKKTSKKHQ